MKPELSAETFSVLAEFYREQEEREMRQAEAAAGTVEPEVAETNPGHRTGQRTGAALQLQMACRAPMALVESQPHAQRPC